MATFRNIALEESSTITARIGAVQIARGSTNELQEILILGDPETSNALGRVLAAAPASTEFGAVVRIASGPSSAADLLMRPVFSSTNTDNPVRAVFSSTNTDNPVSANQAGTWTVNVGTHIQSSVAPAGNSSAVVVRIAGGPSSAADLLMRPVFSSTNTDNPVSANQAGTWTVNVGTHIQSSVAPAGNSSAIVVRIAGGPSSAVDLLMRPVFPSTATDNPVSASQAGTWTVNVGTHIQSSVTPAAGSSGVVVRQVFPTRLSTRQLITVTAGGTSTVVSSAAALRHRIYAFSVTSSVVAFSSVSFRSSNTAERWGFLLGSGSSGITGANLAVAPPGSIFETDVADPLVFSASVAGDYSVSVAYFTEA